MRQHSGLNGKTKEWAAPLNLCRLALESSTDLASLSARLMDKGIIDASDRRLVPQIRDPRSPVGTSRKAFLAEVGHFHSVLTERATQKGRDGTPLKGVVGLQKRLLNSTRRTSDHSGMEAAALAMTFEDAGMMLGDGEQDSRLAKRLFELAAQTTDRVILTERCQSFKGLISEAATQSGRTVSQTALDLERLQMIGKDDPRLAIPVNTVQKLHLFDSREFLTHMRSDLWSMIPQAGPSRSPPFGRDRIVHDVSTLPGRGAAPKDPVALNERDRDFMAAVSRIGERVAMNMHENGRDETGVKNTLAISEAAVIRAHVFDQRALSVQKGARAPSVKSRKPQPSYVM